MYERFEIDLKEASFEWDEEKDQLNFYKHGIHFKTTAKVFLDPDYFCTTVNRYRKRVV